MLSIHREPNGAIPARPPCPAVREGLRSLQLKDGERRATTEGRRRPLARLLVAALLGGIGYGFWSWAPHASWAPQPEKAAPAAKVEAVAPPAPKAAGENLLDVTGYVVARQRISVTAEVGGVVVQVAVEEGMKVKKGDLLLQIDDARYKSDYDQAQAALALAEIQRDELKAGSRPEEVAQAQAAYEEALARRAFLFSEVNRARRAGPGNGVSFSEMDKLQKGLQEADAAVSRYKASLELARQGPRVEKVRAAEAEVARAEAVLARARFFYRRTRIVAPCDAIVLERKAEVGEVIHAEGLSAPLYVLASLADMEAEMDVQERDLPLLKQAQEARVIPDAYPDRSYHARFLRLQPAVNRQRGVVKVRVAILDADESLLADMNCRIVFARARTSSVEPSSPGGD
jgi:multidrug resistance efflux pump